VQENMMASSQKIGMNFSGYLKISQCFEIIQFLSKNANGWV